MKRITHFNTVRDNLLHIETDLGIVNIWVNLHDTEGNEVNAIEIIPTDYEGVILDGSRNNRLIRKGG